jgi:hypothetical protein
MGAKIGEGILVWGWICYGFWEFLQKSFINYWGDGQGKAIKIDDWTIQTIGKDGHPM